MARPKLKLNQKTQEAIRLRIDGYRLVEFLENHALSGEEIPTSRIDAAKFLLSRLVSPPVPKDDAGKTATGPVMIAWQQ